MKKRSRRVQTFGDPDPKRGPITPTGGTGCLCPDNTYHPDCCTGHRKAQGIGRTIFIPELIPLRRIYISDMNDTSITDPDSGETVVDGDLVAVFPDEVTHDILQLRIDEQGNLVASGSDAQYFSITEKGYLRYFRSYE